MSRVNLLRMHGLSIDCEYDRALKRGTVAIIDPLAENYIANMYHVSETLARYLR